MLKLAVWKAAGSDILCPSKQGEQNGSEPRAPAGVLKNKQTFSLDGTVWTAFVDKSSKATYFYNNKTGLSQWEDPRVSAAMRGMPAKAASRPKVHILQHSRGCCCVLKPWHIRGSWVSASSTTGWKHSRYMKERSCNSPRRKRWWA